jgi:hypothetical protein
LEPAEFERRKTLGLLKFDHAVAGTNRLPLIPVFLKRKNSKTPERLCMKFLTQGFACTTADCKFPHVTDAERLPAAEKAKLIEFVKRQPGITWADGRAPAGTA